MLSPDPSPPSVIRFRSWPGWWRPWPGARCRWAGREDGDGVRPRATGPGRPAKAPALATGKGWAPASVARGLGECGNRHGGWYTMFAAVGPFCPGLAGRPAGRSRPEIGPLLGQGSLNLPREPLQDLGRDAARVAHSVSGQGSLGVAPLPSASAPAPPDGRRSSSQPWPGGPNRGRESKSRKPQPPDTWREVASSQDSAVPGRASYRQMGLAARDS